MLIMSLIVASDDNVVDWPGPALKLGPPEDPGRALGGRRGAEDVLRLTEGWRRSRWKKDGRGLASGSSAGNDPSETAPECLSEKNRETVVAVRPARPKTVLLMTRL